MCGQRSQGAIMDLGAWLRSLGLERYEAAFRENAIAADVLRDLTDQDLEKIGVLLGDRRRLLRAIAALDEAPASPTSPAPAPASVNAHAAASPISAEVEVSGERPNVVTLRANQPALLKADVANEGLALENAIRQVATETRQVANGAASGNTDETAVGNSSCRAGASGPRQYASDRSSGGGLARCAPQCPSAAAERAVCGERTSSNELSATTLSSKGTISAPRQSRRRKLPLPRTIRTNRRQAPRPEKAPQAARPPGDTYEPEPGTATAKAPQAARPPRDTYEPEAGAATAKAPPARPLRDTYEPEAGAVTAKAPRPARPQRNSHQPAVPAATAKGPQPARVPRDSYEPKARTASTKAPQPARLPRDSYEPQARAAPAKAPRAALPRAIHTSRRRAPRQSRRRELPVSRAIHMNSEELRYPPVIEAEPTSPEHRARPRRKRI